MHAGASTRARGRLFGWTRSIRFMPRFRCTSESNLNLQPIPRSCRCPSLLSAVSRTQPTAMFEIALAISFVDYDVYNSKALTVRRACLFVADSFTDEHSLCKKKPHISGGISACLISENVLTAKKSIEEHI